MKNNKKQILLWIALIVVALFIAKFATSSWRKYQAWETHKSFFELPVEEQNIKTWMSPNFIQRHYGIELDSVLGFDLGFWEMRKPLADICNDHHMNCDKLISKIDTLIKNNPDKSPVR